jgi:hypothetical protein
MTSTIDYNEVKEEIVVFLRNNDVLSTTQRNVVTLASTGSISNSTTITIPISNVKNIRSLTVGGTSKAFGTDYLVDYNSGTNCVITLAATATAAYTATLDYGTDKIFSDFPRTDLSVSSFPRITVDVIGDDSIDIGVGATSKMTTLSFSIYVYDTKANSIDATLKTIREKFLANQKTFYYQRYVNRVRTGPLMLFTTYGDNRIMLKAVDYLSSYNLEYS